MNGIRMLVLCICKKYSKPPKWRCGADGPRTWENIGTMSLNVAASSFSDGGLRGTEKLGPG